MNRSLECTAILQVQATPHPCSPLPSLLPRSRPGCTVITGVTGTSHGPISLLLSTPLNNGGTPVLSYRIDGVPAAAGRANITANGLGQPLSPNQVGKGGWEKQVWRQVDARQLACERL